MKESTLKLLHSFHATVIAVLAAMFTGTNAISVIVAIFFILTFIKDFFKWTDENEKEFTGYLYEKKEILEKENKLSLKEKVQINQDQIDYSYKRKKRRRLRRY